MSTKWKNVNVHEIIELSSIEKQDLAIAEMFCPNCKRYTSHVFTLGYNNPLEGMNYCPRCGERMKVEQDECS